MFGRKKEKEMLNVYDVIPQKEQAMIRNWITTEGCLFSGLKQPIAELDHILRFWAQAKIPFYHMFGDKLIISRRVDYECPMAELRDKVYREADVEVMSFIRELGAILRDYNHPIGHALREAGIYSYEFYNEGLWDLLIENKWPFCDVQIPMDNGKFYTCKTGMRVTRIFQKLADLAGVTGFEKVRELHAKISTSKIVHGNMYLSIHPLDFMTMSDNADGWDSCMNWRDSGDYRSGTVEMMNSPVVVEAYLVSDKNRLQIDEDEWPSKIWRELYIVHPDYISNIRSYPFLNAGLSKFAVTWLKELAEQAGYGSYYPELLRNGDNCSDYLEKMDCNFHLETNNMYNDYFREDQYVYVSKDFQYKYKDTFYLNYSGIMSCMNCGEIMDSHLEETRMVMCDECSDSADDYYVCDYCGDEMHHESEVYYVDDVMLCNHCYHDTECVGIAYDDDETHLLSNMTKVYLGTPDHDVYIWVYDVSSWLRRNTDGVTKDKLKYVYNDYSSSWAEQVLMLSIDDVSDDMLMVAGIRDRKSYREGCHEAGEEKFQSMKLPSWLSA